VAHRFGTAEWAKALEEEINASSEYRNAAAKWGVGFNGTILLVFEPDGVLTDPLHLLVRLQGGTCQGAEFVANADHKDAGFTLSASFSLWRDILARRTLAATAILRGDLAVRGPKMTLLRNTAAARALLHCTASVESIFPGD